MLSAQFFRREGRGFGCLAGLTKRFGDSRSWTTSRWTIEQGRLCCLLGPSGCGKTTALRLVAGFIEPTAGEILVGERVVSSPARTLPPERRNMSMVFQSYALWPHMTVAENVAYGLKLRKVDRDTISRKVGAMLATTKLERLADRYPGELSGGQQQRVALARALIVEPETLLLDEPLSNLDANLREEMRFEVRRLHDEYRYTTVYVTHDQSEAMTTADLIAVMNHGKIEQVGSPEEIYDRPRSEFVARFIGSSNVVTGKVLDDRRISVAASCCAAAAAARAGRAAPCRSGSTTSGSAGRAREARRTWCRRRVTRKYSSAAAATIWSRPRRARSCGWWRRQPEHSAGRAGLAAPAAGTLPGAERLSRQRGINERQSSETGAERSRP